MPAEPTPELMDIMRIRALAALPFLRALAAAAVITTHGPAAASPVAPGQPAADRPIPVSTSLQDDEPDPAVWHDAEDLPWPDTPWSAPHPALVTPMTPDDVRAMAELDGDPDTLTPAEAEMLRVLQQVIGAEPLERNQP